MDEFHDFNQRDEFVNQTDKVGLQIAWHTRLHWPHMVKDNILLYGSEGET